MDAGFASMNVKVTDYIFQSLESPAATTVGKGVASVYLFAGEHIRFRLLTARKRE